MCIVVVMNSWLRFCEPDTWHYQANVFPLLSRDELEGLASDIKKHGLLNPIVRCVGKVLDGRNRALACRLVQIEPKFRDITTEEAMGWSLSQNLYRRHIKPDEQALALHLLESLSGEKQENTKGKKRERAYKKLARLKTAIVEWADGLPLPTDYAERLRDMLGVKDNKEKPSIFVELSSKLNIFVPTYSDGVEHVVVRLLNEVCNAPKDNLNATDSAHLKSIVYLLGRIVEEFSAYSRKLTCAERSGVGAK